MNLKQTYADYSRLLSKRALLFPQLYRYSRALREFLARKRLSNPGRLREQEEKGFAALCQEGYAPAETLVDAEMREELVAACDALQALAVNAPRRKNKQFFSSLMPEDLAADSILVRFALQENILQLVASYFKESPYLYNVDLLASYGGDGTKWDQSQLWHQDTADAKVLKLWVYISDVLDAEHGPFSYLPANYSRKLPNPFHRRVSDAQIRELGYEDKAVPVLGPRKTAFLIDTRNCYHLGSRVLGQNVRVAYVATYFSFATLSPNNSIRPANQILSPIQQLALMRG